MTTSKSCRYTDSREFKLLTKFSIVCAVGTVVLASINAHNHATQQPAASDSASETVTIAPPGLGPIQTVNLPASLKIKP